MTAVVGTSHETDRCGSTRRPNTLRLTDLDDRAAGLASLGIGLGGITDVIQETTVLRHRLAHPWGIAVTVAVRRLELE